MMCQILLLFFLFILTVPVHARIGCMSTYSDTGVSSPIHHYVGCNCPCNEMVSGGQNQCITCGHYRRPDQWYVVGAGQQSRKKRPQRKKITKHANIGLFYDPSAVVGSLAQQYKEGDKAKKVAKNRAKGQRKVKKA